MDKHASETMRNSLMYKLSYYRFNEVQTSYNRPPGYDTVRNQNIGDITVKLNHFEEAFTSENWIVRIYRVKKANNRNTFRMIEQGS